MITPTDAPLAFSKGKRLVWLTMHPQIWLGPGHPAWASDGHGRRVKFEKSHHWRRYFGDIYVLLSCVIPMSTAAPQLEPPRRDP